MHVGMIPDGHRRYADNHNIDNKEAYLKSQDLIFESCKKFSPSDKEEIEPDVDEVTVYALSEQNLRRDKEELDIFYSAINEYMDGLLRGESLGLDIVDEVDIKFISTNLSPIPEDTVKRLEKVEDKFCGESITLNILFCYDGRKEIVEACDKTRETTKSNIWENLKLENEIDFVIRTGDNPYRECLSGFPIWQSSYSEYYHIKKNFPSINIENIKEALEHYKKLRRKKGE